MIEAALVGAGASLLGGLFGSSSSRKRQAESDKRNYEAQKEFAQHGIQWRVADARAAGLHPLAALGSSGSSFTPSFQSAFAGGTDPLASGISDAGRLMAEGMGQNISRAQRAQQEAFTREVQALQLRRMALENAHLEGQISHMWASTMGQPDTPSKPGVGAAVGISTDPVFSATGNVRPGIVQLKPSESESTRPGDPGLAAGKSPLFREQQVAPGRSWNLLNPEAGEAFEAYGELVKPILAMAAHGERYWAQQMIKEGLPPETSVRDYILLKIRGLRKPSPPSPARRGGATSSW